jgi:hypothetical protein
MDPAVGRLDEGSADECSRGATRFVPRLEVLEDRSLPSGVVTGLVFEDFNANGRYDPNPSLTNSSGIGSVGLAADRPVAGVTVLAFDANNRIVGAALTTGTATTVNGSPVNYVLNVGGVGPYRIELTALPAGFSSGPSGPDSQSTVQFVPDGNTGQVSVGLVRAGDFSQNAPDLVTSCYVFGDQINGPNRNDPVVIGFPYAVGSNSTTNSFGRNDVGAGL